MNGENEKLVFVDIETTGLDPTGPIIQIAAIATNCRWTELETFEAKIRLPKNVKIDYLGSRYDHDVWTRTACSPRRAALKFSRFLSRHATVDLISGRDVSFQVAQLVAHNAEFDTSFLRNWYGSLDLFLAASYRPLCTLQRALWLFDENKSLTPPTNYKLTTLCQYFGVSLLENEAHDALADVRATVKLYREMTKFISVTSRCPQTTTAEACG